MDYLQQRRLIEHVRTLYRSNALVGPLPLRQLQSRALPFESYKLALTPGLVAAVYGGRVTDAMLEAEGPDSATSGAGSVNGTCRRAATSRATPAIDRASGRLGVMSRS